MNFVSHPGPRIVTTKDPQAEVLSLTEAFTEFISASAHLEEFYASLQLEVTRLRQELADRDSALEASLIENGRMHRQMEEERQLVLRATTRSEGAAMLAHEMRNPLSSLELFAGLLAEGVGDPEMCLCNLLASVRSLATRVGNVKGLHDDKQVSLTPIDLAWAIESSVNFAQPICSQAGIELAYSGPSVPICVLGHCNSLRQVVLNMVCNAVQHTDENGSIQIQVDEAEAYGRACIRIADSGRGISGMHLPHIFKAGFSGDGISSGIGLAVCRRLIDQHQGSIRVESQLGVGTTFFVELPTV
jgi:two-component system sensor histidine kinase FlrB